MVILIDPFHSYPYIVSDGRTFARWGDVHHGEVRIPEGVDPGGNLWRGPHDPRPEAEPDRPPYLAEHGNDHGQAFDLGSIDRNELHACVQGAVAGGMRGAPVLDLRDGHQSMLRPQGEPNGPAAGNGHLQHAAQVPRRAVHVGEIQPQRTPGMAKGRAHVVVAERVVGLNPR